jgi:hypothetical protein
MQEMWVGGRYPHVEDWFIRLRARPSFQAALLDWLPAALREEMAENGLKSWPDVRELLND